MYPRTTFLAASALVLVNAGVVLLTTQLADSQTQVSMVLLQPTPPSTPQTGHFSITWSARAGSFIGGGAGLTCVPWASITGAPTSFTPSGAAGGDLAGTYPNPWLATYAGSLTKVSGGVMASSAGRIVIGTSGLAGGVAVGESGNFQRAAINSDGTQGFVQANIMNFREPNELDPDTDIVYASTEGPEAAACVRGTAQLVGGRAFVELPDHSEVSVIEEGMTVQVTPLSGASKGLAVVRKSLDGVEVQELHGGTGSYAFDREVKAVRKGHRNYQPVRP